MVTNKFFKTCVSVANSKPIAPNYFFFSNSQFGTTKFEEISVSVALNIPLS